MWELYEWNPPEYLKHIDEFSEADPSADLQPMWEELVGALPMARMGTHRRRGTVGIHIEGNRRITEAYGATDWQDEIQIRLGGRQPAGSDAERDRLRSRHASLKTWVEHADRTIADLEAFDPTDDARWQDAG